MLESDQIKEVLLLVTFAPNRNWMSNLTKFLHNVVNFVNNINKYLDFKRIIKKSRPVLAQGLKRVTISATVVGSIPSRINEMFYVFVFSLC